MKRYVLKFGGSSLETIDKMKIVANRIIDRYNEEVELIVVVSAMGKTTSNLYNEARKISLLPNKRDLDLLLSTGEITSIAYLSIILNDLGYPAICLTGPRAKIYTAGEFQNSKIIDIDVKVILKYLKEKKIVIVAGYQGVNSDGDITTLGREGSDTTAVTLSYYLNCPCEIYSDVDGIYEVNPRIMMSKKHNNLAYNDTLLLSYHGAKVIATSAVEFAKANGVHLYLASTFNEEEKGTSINNDEGSMWFTGIVIQMNNRILKLLKTISDEVLEKNLLAGIRIDKISDMLISLSGDDLILLEEVINNVLDEDDYQEEYVDCNLVKISVIGTMFEDENMVSKLLSRIEKEMINVYATKLEKNRLSIFTDYDNAYLYVKKLYKIVGGLNEYEKT